MKDSIIQTIVVNGLPVEVATLLDYPIEMAVMEALSRSKYDIPRAQWELKDATGKLVDNSLTVEQARQTVVSNIPHSDKFFLCLRAGIGA